MDEINRNIIREEYTLLAVCPCETVEQKLLQLREKIFAHTGFASALALPPLMPLCYLPGNLNSNAVREVLAAHKPEAPLVLSGIREKEQTIYLQTYTEQQPAIQTTFLAEKILAARRTENSPEAADSPLFPIIPGFFLAVNQHNLDIKQLSSLWNPGEGMHLRTFHLILLRILVHAPRETWWENTEWEVEISVKNRKSAKPAPD